MTDSRQFPYQGYQRDLTRIRQALKKTTVLMYLVLCAIVVTPMVAFWLYFSIGSMQLDRQLQQQTLDQAYAQMTLLAEQHDALTRRGIADLAFENLQHAQKLLAEAHPRIYRIQTFSLYGEELRRILDTLTKPGTTEDFSGTFMENVLPESAADLEFIKAVRLGETWYHPLPFDSVPANRVCVPFPYDTGSYRSAYCMDYLTGSVQPIRTALLKESFYIAFATTLVALFILLSIMMHQRQYRLSLDLLQKQRDLFLNSSLTDPLTGALNRRAFHLAYASAQSQLQRSNLPFAVITMDLDHFKEINDAWGHAFGDQVLAELVSRLQNVLRSSDHLARLGGEEFSIICNVPDEKSAMSMADKLRMTIANIDSRAPDGSRVSFTVSVGIHIPARGEDMKIALNNADTAMYQAKEAGRNRTKLYTD